MVKHLQANNLRIKLGFSQFSQFSGLEKGELYAFGLGLTFEGQNMSSQDLKRVESTLKYKGFAPAIVNDFIILVLNGELKHLFTYYNVMTVPILNTLPFVKMFDKMADGLLRHEVEGFIITIPSKGECDFENDNINLPIHI